MCVQLDPYGNTFGNGLSAKSSSTHMAPQKVGLGADTSSVFQLPILLAVRRAIVTETNLKFGADMLQATYARGKRLQQTH